MPIEHVPNDAENNDFPFAYLPSINTDTRQEHIIGEGWESVVKQLGPNVVLKEVNHFDSQGNQRSQEKITSLRSVDRVEEMTLSQARLEEIFGTEHFARASFIYSKDQNGKEGYVLVQRLINGETLANLIGTEYSNTQEMILKNREQFMDIVWGLKKSFIEFGVPIDFHPGNLIREDETGNLVIMDTGIPSEVYRVITDEGATERAATALEHVYKRMERIQKYENFLHLSAEEKRYLNEKYQITDDEYKDSISNIDRIRQENGIEIEVESDPVGNFLNSIFGERQEVSGREIHDYALQILGPKQPTQSQESILKKLNGMSSVTGDRGFWRKLIDL